MGRPTDYDKITVAEICSLIAEGNSVRSICKREDMPCYMTVYRWIAKYPEFAIQYAQAKEICAEVLADEMIDIADDGRNDWIELHGDATTKEAYRLNGEAINRSRLRVDTRKWAAAHLLPKKYGDVHNLQVSGTIRHEMHLDPGKMAQLTPDQRAEVERLLQTVWATVEPLLLEPPPSEE